MEQDPQYRGQDQDGGVSPIQTMPSASPHQPVGPWIGAGIVVILLVVGALYFWGAKLNERASGSNLPPFITDDNGNGGYADSAIEADVYTVLPPQSDSDEIEDIEADLAAMDMSGFEWQTESDLYYFEEGTY
ncbi:hypothetical protein COU20_03040 [Candidatus Kaiserbacteria bacterium CG10_big_fil_rev_8_21_14_0_10_59_10]|uniref:Uncharacterized protein n=1 Tax=Candidatus Kaiserbacteria bacterium CG10_big_fil_rev_8_21_14_0_10_59_10 TaxID=1974612 RepID=A0A2H0U7B9_9BACT|nr:MAG: hypothetical protein COU20_03040 [Candidatus Kaiserbacteria bacterium CG10_big_fil_rev_8_21_14_0_10_59_10]